MGDEIEHDKESSTPQPYSLSLLHCLSAIQDEELLTQVIKFSRNKESCPERYGTPSVPDEHKAAGGPDKCGAHGGRFLY